MKHIVGQLLHRLRCMGPWLFLAKNVFEIKDIASLKRAMGWTKDPSLDGLQLDEFRYLEDINDRRMRDGEVLGAACRNMESRILLEIGTSKGESTALMAQNAPLATVYTVNMLPEQICGSGKAITAAPSEDEIGSYYRQRGFNNVRQIFANTAVWEPDFGPIDVAFIDGCHDADFVFNDTRKILKKCHPGSIILWHDFSPVMIRKHAWIAEVCRGVERLYRRGVLHGPILHMKDSWMGLYRVTEEDL